MDNSRGYNNSLFDLLQKVRQEEVEDAFRRGKADGYRQAILERDRRYSDSDSFIGESNELCVSPITPIKLITGTYSKSYFLVSAIIGMCKEFGFCPDIVGWECYPDCGGRSELCNECWKKARERAEAKERN